jgi:hypothetical protein
VHEDLAVRHVGYLPNALSTVGIFDLAEVSVTMDETSAFERMVHDLQMDLRRLGVTMCKCDTQTGCLCGLVNPNRSRHST